MALAGDVMLGRKVGAELPDRPPEATWGEVGRQMRQADATLVNLECVIAERGRPEPGRTFHFQAPPEAVDVLQAAGVDAVSVANNHALDMGGPALAECLERLREAGIATVGAGETVEAAWAPARVQAGELDVAVIAFTDNVPSWNVERRQPGVAYAQVDTEKAGFAQLRREVEGLAREADLVVVSAHWGPNMRRCPPESFRAFARRLVDAGADVFWGHSAHLFQAVEPRDGSLILYDTGDLVDDYRRDPEEHNEISFLFRVEAGARRVHRVAMEPVRIDPAEGSVDRADASARSFAVGRMRELCEELGTELRETEGRLVAPVA
jgi:poly-gamma-glutamate synthesis protein (capsule biosynthesis protein)